jgi:hypothetical protein
VNEVLAGSLRYFGFGEIELRQTERQMNNFEPYLLMNLSIDVRFLKIKRNILHMAVAGRYIRSNLKVITDTEMHLQLIHLRLMLLDSTSEELHTMNLMTMESWI